MRLIDKIIEVSNNMDQLNKVYSNLSGTPQGEFIFREWHEQRLILIRLVNDLMKATL